MLDVYAAPVVYVCSNRVTAAPVRSTSSFQIERRLSEETGKPRSLLRTGRNAWGLID